jgi:hypothetical protein
LGLSAAFGCKEIRHIIAYIIVGGKGIVEIN